jgi:hypothetical protein
LLNLKKMENGQFEVGPALPPAAPEAPEPARPPRATRAPAAEQKPEVKPEAKPEKKTEARAVAAEPKEVAPPPPPAAEIARPLDIQPLPEPGLEVAGDGLRDAYELLQRATNDLTRSKGSAIRDSDVKRRMLELRPGFDEGAFGFSKFSRFLRQAHDAEVINLQKVENGSYEVSPGARASAYRPARPEAEPRPPRETDGAEPRAERPHRRRGRDRDRERRGRPQNGAAEVTGAESVRPADVEAAAVAAPQKKPEPVKAPAERAAAPAAAVPPAAKPAPAAPPATAPSAKPGVSLGFRRGSRGGLAAAAPPPILAGQTIQPAASAAAAPAPVAQPEPVKAEEKRSRRPARRTEAAPARAQKPAGPSADGAVAWDQLSLPTSDADVVERLASYKGVGRKSAEVTVQAFGAPAVFRVLHEQPERVRQTLGGRRAELLLKGWQQDLASLTGASATRSAARKARPTAGDTDAAAPVRARKTRRGGRKNSRKKAGSTNK